MSIKKSLFMLLSAGLFFCIAAFNTQAQNTQVTVSGIKSQKGKIVLNVFKDSEGYEDQKPLEKLVFDKKGLTNGTIVLNCKLQPGTYGITLLDDENQNGTMDKNIVGIPKEGFGFSNFYMEKMKKPSFDDFKTTIKSEDNKIEIKVKNM